MLIIDAQKALEFLVPQAAAIEAKVYKIKYPAIRYSRLIPVDSSMNPWAPSLVTYTSDITGQAAWYNGKAQDVALAEVTRDQKISSMHMAAIGYKVNSEEIAIAQMMGQNLSSDKAGSARFAAERFIDDVALRGDASKGLTGLVNCGYVSVVPASAAWATLTRPQILAQVNGLLTGVYVGSNTVEMADTLLLPVPTFTMLADTPFNDYSEKTLLDYIKQTNVYTQETGQPLTIASVRGLDTAGAGNTSRVVAYRKSEEVLKLILPMPFRFLAPWQRGPLEWDVPGIFRLGCTDIRLPGAVRYMDGV